MCFSCIFTQTTESKPRFIIPLASWNWPILLGKYQKEMANFLPELHHHLYHHHLSPLSWSTSASSHPVLSVPVIVARPFTSLRDAVWRGPLAFRAEWLHGWKWEEKKKKKKKKKEWTKYTEKKRRNQDSGCNGRRTAWGLLSVSRGGGERERERQGYGRKSGSMKESIKAFREKRNCNRPPFCKFFKESFRKQCGFPTKPAPSIVAAALLSFSYFSLCFYCLPTKIIKRCGTRFWNL